MVGGLVRVASIPWSKKVTQNPNMLACKKFLSERKHDLLAEMVRTVRLVSGCIAAVLVTSRLCFGQLATVRADPFIEDGLALEHGMAIEIGGIAQSGYSEYASPVGGITPELQGLVLRDRNGLVARSFFGLVIALATAARVSGPKSVDTRTYDSGNYRVTETRTTYYSDAEKAQIRKEGSDSIDGLFNLRNSEFELQVYSRDRFGSGDASGYKANFLVGDGSKTMVFEAGVGFGDVDSTVSKNGMGYAVNHRYFGVPLRLSGAISKIRWSAAFEWNWLSHGLSAAYRAPTLGMDGITRMTVAPNPLHLDVQAAVLGRLYVSGGVTFPSVKQFDHGYRLSAGLRF